MLSKFLKYKRSLLAMFIIFIVYFTFVYLHKDIVEGIENMTTKTCNKDECKKNCPEFDIKCLKEHADTCGDCQFNVSELSDEINNKSFHNNMNIEQPPQKPVNIYVMNQNDPHNHDDERYMLGILPNRGPSSVDQFNESIVFSGPKKKNYVLVNPKSGNNIFPITTSTTGMFTQTGYYPSNTGDQKDASEHAAPNVDQFKQPTIDKSKSNTKRTYTSVRNKDNNKNRDEFNKKSNWTEATPLD